ncbi:hypothetical protein [uncultured Nocardioides sp.]|uniref:hypothetical protein n=1 Tax=uncultured Nocardioides sp. TaxID=198441 RepID=UPI00260A3686|nr:hypothetical protein [uncultured Nocardioides sp.]
MLRPARPRRDEWRSCQRREEVLGHRSWQVIFSYAFETLEERARREGFTAD